MAVGRGRKVTIVLVVLFVVLAGLLVAVDRIGAYEAEQTIAQQAQQELTRQGITSPERPTVHVAGFPFLTQVISGKYHKITIEIAQPTTQGVTLRRLDIVATDVKASASALINGSGDVVASKVTGTGDIGWDQVTKLIKLTGVDATGVTVTSTDAGVITVKVPLTLAGFSTTVVATGTAKVSQGTVQLSIAKVAAEGGNVPALVNSLIGQLAQTLDASFPIQKLPYGMVVTDSKATSSGLTLTAVATNVPLASGSKG